MRTLKKVLALSLVFAMAFTLMAGAAYNDEDSIDSSLRDDITLLEALGVFQGDENGNFNPTANVTRAEAAKMIYVLKNNGVDDKAVAFQGVATFSDVPVGHWAEGYVNYCANLGIMAGWTENGQKVFNPSGNVTGVELTKMLLCLVGYKADVQGYTNNNAWQTNVLMDGANAGITNNYTPSVYAAAPRQWTARLLVNAINAPFVTYNRGEIMYGTADDPTLSYGRNYLRLSIAEGTLTATDTVRVIDTVASTPGDNFADSLRGTNQDDVTVYVTEINNHQNTDNKPYGSTVYEDIDADNALLGQKVKVYYRTANFTDTKPTEVFAVLADSSEKVVNTTVDQISFDSNNTSRVTVAGEGTMTYSKNTATSGQPANGHQIDVYVDNTLMGEGYDKDTLQDLGLGVKSSDAVKLIYDEDGYVVKAFISKAPVYAVIDEIDAGDGVLRLVDAGSGVVNLYDANNTRITFNRSNSDNFDKYLNIDSSVAAEDVVKITRNVSTGELKYDVTVLNAVNSNVQSYTTDEDSNKNAIYDVMTIDGTEYKLSKYKMNSYDWALTTGNAGHDTFYVDGSYVVYSTGESDSASISNLAYVYGTGASEDSFGSITYRVKVLLADGTKGSYVLNKNSGLGEVIEDMDLANNKAKKDELAKHAGEIFTYSLRDNTITLNVIDDADVKDTLNGNRATYMDPNNSPIAYDHDDAVVTVNDVEYVVNDSTYFFVQDESESGDDRFAVVKASELKDNMSGDKDNIANVFVAQNINGFKTILAGFVQTTGVVTTEAEDYYFVTGSPLNRGENSDGDYVIELPVNAAGTDATLEFKYSSNQSSRDDMANLNKLTGKLINVDLESDGSVAGSDAVTVIKAVNYSAEVANDNDQWIIGDLSAWSSTRATIGGNNFKVAEDVKIFNVDVDSDGDATFEGEGSAVKAEEIMEDKDGELVGTGKYFENAVFVRNTDGEISAIFTEIDGTAISAIVTAE